MGVEKRNQLTDRAVKGNLKPGKHGDGQGLYLQVGAKGAKSWLFIFRWDGKLKEMGLGSVTKLTLAKAREAAREARQLVHDGINPIYARRLKIEEAMAVPLFLDFGRKMVSEWSTSWKNDIPWDRTLRLYTKNLNGKPVNAITTEDVLHALRAIWVKHPATAVKVRGRIERILDAAKVAGFRSGENPARWNGHLKLMLANHSKAGGNHHNAMSRSLLPSFVQVLRGNGSMSALALEFVILTACRTSEARLALRSEIDFDAKVWTIPANRTKAGRDHRVPLCDRALEILHQVWPISNRADAYIFKGGSKGIPAQNIAPGCLSDMAMLELLRGLSKERLTVHGFRSTFRDWAGDETDFPREMAEAALGHIVGDLAEQAYRRGDALERRRALMQAWADYLREGED